ncbi:hypothetical protein Cgig2_004928 [Carnegiea gigantea]|uniref:Uncharacterized protein n=1 Tax=Carnegiea gigantea TaxID=171969 RepID=A0A9Q1QS83_9CARY|nr:hypothetical protein Cgig2_004928 [Carnegiea gigantea]
MAGVGTFLSPPIGASKSTAVKFSRPNMSAGTPFRVRLSGSSHRHCRHALSACSERELVVSEGPSCIFVGPIETASQETLEALYRQARDAYYSGTPLIVDDMFDRVEEQLKLRWYGSNCVVKYPRCSLRRQSTYADAQRDTCTLIEDVTMYVGQEDPSQVFALASIWFLILVFGSCVCLLPMLYNITLAFQDAFKSEVACSSQSSAMENSLGMLNSVLLMLIGSVIGFPIASASAKALQGLWRNDLVALKGACPNCGEEVFAFVRSDQSNGSPHRADCHVCECLLEFRTKVEKSSPKQGQRWVHGRVYLISKRQNHQR